MSVPDLARWGLPLAASMHESAHAMVAWLLEVPVAAVGVWHPDGNRMLGLTRLEVGDTPEDLWKTAVVTAAGIVANRRLGIDGAWSAEDREKLKLLRDEFGRAVRPMPDALAVADDILRNPVLVRAWGRLAEVLTPGKVHDGGVVRATLDPIYRPKPAEASATPEYVI